MASEKCAKLVGITCSIGVLCAMYSGTLGTIIFVFIALPLAIYCRKKMHDEKDEVNNILLKEEAKSCIKCNCFEGLPGVSKEEECFIFFKKKKIEIVTGSKESKRISINYKDIKAANIYTLEQAIIRARSKQANGMGELGVSLALLDSSKRKNTRKVNLEKDVYYIIFTVLDSNNKNIVLSFFCGREYKRFNSLSHGIENAQDDFQKNLLFSS